MAASTHLQNLFSINSGRKQRKDFGALARVFGRDVIPFLVENVVPTAESVSADLLDFAESDIVEVIRSSRRLFAGRTSPIESAKQRRQPRRDFSENISDQSSQTFFGINFL